tara:strand:- start:1058 stop:1294 length:237 start_codon:yes stop_codon:yes gene_type:complete
MKGVIYLSALILMGATTLISCRDKAEKETVVIKEVRVETEKAEPVEESKGILERTAEKVDKEVNKEIDKEIEKIGDDN